MSLARRATAGTVLLVGSAIVSQIVGLLEIVVLARLLDPGAFGTYALARFFFDLLQRFRQVWVGYFLIREEQVTEGRLATLLGVQVIIGGALVLLAILGVPLIRSAYGGVLALVFLAIAAVAVFDDIGLGSIPLALLERDLRYREVVTVSLSAKVLGVSAAITSAWLGWGVWALVGEQAAIALTTFAGYSACVGPRMSSSWRGLRRLFDGREARRLLRTEGSYLWLLGIGYWLTNSLGDYLVGSRVGLIVLGYYTRAYVLSSFQVGILGSLGRVMFPVYSRLRRQADQVTTAYRMSMGLIARGSTLAALILFVAAEPIVAVVLGPRWKPTVPLIRAFVAFQIARPIFDALGSLLMALGHLRSYALGSLGSAGAMLIVGGLATVLFGATGTALALGLVTAAAAWAFHRHLPEDARRLSLEIFSPPLLTGGAAMAVSMGVVGLWPSGASSWTAELARLAVPIAGYCLALVVIERRSLVQTIRFVRERLARGEPRDA